MSFPESDVIIQRYIIMLRDAIIFRKGLDALKAIDNINNEVSRILNMMKRTILTNVKYTAAIRIVNDYTIKTQRLKDFILRNRFYLARRELPAFEAALFRVKTSLMLLYSGAGVTATSQIYPALMKAPIEIPEEIQRISPQAALVYSMLQAVGGRSEIGEISQRTGLSTEDVERIANLLVAGGYATLEYDPLSKKIFVELKWESI